ncbi:hypothetical protein AMELA_G00184100 [Ameiurus melas]|uniref:Uncharacterized protein n=1 Tax=Ameiurus melas TaxID=219545 RepID=A0A7J6ACZ6_AMEME|nr:hypothetical protein AMELA_G00184100 [Ameiurus melas]
MTSILARSADGGQHIPAQLTFHMTTEKSLLVASNTAKLCMWKTAPRHFLTETYKQSALKHPPQLVQVASLADDLNQRSACTVTPGRTVTIKLISFKCTSASVPLVTSPRARGAESGVSVSSGPFGPE